MRYMFSFIICKSIKLAKVKFSSKHVQGKLGLLVNISLFLNSMYGTDRNKDRGISQV